MKISVCGKGGSGKSTVVSLLALQSAARGIQTLVVDADESNADGAGRPAKAAFVLRGKCHHVSEHGLPNG